MYWIYILKCKGGFAYIGETKRLYRRFWEHMDENGGVNTLTYTPKYIAAIYPMHKLGKYFEYMELLLSNNNSTFIKEENMRKNFNWNEDDDDENYNSRRIENNIAECLMINNPKKWEKVRGGKYIRFDCQYKFPDNKFAKYLPLCKCGLPCDVHTNDNSNNLFYRCPKKNFYEDFIEEHEVDKHEPCDFFKKIDNTKYLEMAKKFKYQISNSHWLDNIPEFPREFCSGECGKQLYDDSMIVYRGNTINLCHDCFINKNEELRIKHAKYIISDSEDE